MKKLLMALVSVVAVTATAQSKMTGSVYNTGSYHDVTPKLGFVAGAANLGVNYNLMNDGAGWGGYFFMQTEKKDAGIKQAMAFGGSYKMNLIDTAHVTAYMSPGFGIAMLKDASTNQTTGATSDETVFGPAYSIGAQMKLPAGMAIGLERSAFTNWFNDKVGTTEFTAYQVAFSMRF